MNLSPCNHEETVNVTHIILHVADAVNKGHKYIMVRANDTDVVILAVSIYHELNNLTELWVSFSTDNNLRYIAVIQITDSFGSLKSKALTVVHVFTGVMWYHALHQNKSHWYGTLGEYIQNITSG